MKIGRVISAAAVVGFLALSVIPCVAQSPVITKLTEKYEPLAVTDIRANGASVTFDKNFTASGDWMRSLTFSVKNQSDKDILFFNFDLLFAAPRSDTPTAIFDLLSYGNPALPIRHLTLNERVNPIAPGQTVEIGFSDQTYRDLTSFLHATRHSQNPDKITLRIGQVIFGDDSMWYIGNTLYRDATDPAKWIKPPR